MSFQQFAPGGSVGFLHTHKTHEELYIILGGDGEFQVDGQVFPVGEGSVVRVSPAGRRSLRNTGDSPMTMICIQYKAASFDAGDAADGEILHAQIEPGTCPPMQSRPECTLRPAFLIFPQGYSSPSSGSATRIRPQYSQTISFLPWRISTWRCGGIRLKQPPQASRFTVTTASPLRTLLRMRP